MFDTKKDLQFNSIFAKACSDFVIYKRSFNCKYNTEAYLMEKFDQMVVSKGVSEPILTKEIVFAFIQKRPEEAGKSAYNRLIFIRQFARFLETQGYYAYLPQPTKVVRSSFAPYIFTKNDVAALLSEIDRIKPNKSAWLRHLVYPVLFRMLYSCGLRINEALHLKISDIDFTTGVISIKNAKFNSERLVPMSESLTRICRDYHNRVLSTMSSARYFFPAKDGGFLDNNAIWVYFKKVIVKCKIPKTARIHDLRHTFAVHTLNKWANDGKDLYILLPILSTYMGHATISATANYLRLTAEVYPDITRLINEKYSGIIPEVAKS